MLCSMPATKVSTLTSHLLWCKQLERMENGGKCYFHGFWDYQKSSLATKGIWSTSRSQRLRSLWNQSIHQLFIFLITSSLMDMRLFHSELWGWTVLVPFDWAQDTPDTKDIFVFCCCFTPYYEYFSWFDAWDEEEKAWVYTFIYRLKGSLTSPTI